MYPIKDLSSAFEEVYDQSGGMIVNGILTQGDYDKYP
jgi:hypothetical protein